MNLRIKATGRFVKQLRDLITNWDFYTKDNTGFYVGKIRFWGYDGEHVWTKHEVIDLIMKNKEYIRKELGK